MTLTDLKRDDRVRRNVGHPGITQNATRGIQANTRDTATIIPVRLPPGETLEASTGIARPGACVTPQ